jgi:hypothetical protein
MTSIKPPSSGTTGPHTLDESSASAGHTGAGAGVTTEGPAGSSFRQTLNEAGEAGRASQPSQVGLAGLQGGADPVGSLAREVEAGRISMDQAAEQLLERALASVDRHLGANQRAELKDLLRNALANDPTLAALVSGRLGSGHAADAADPTNNDRG